MTRDTSTRLFTRPRRRTAALVGGLTTAMAAALVAAVTGGTPVAAAAAPDCPEPFPVAEVADGQAVTGLTVSRGTTPDGFTGEVLGVLQDAVAPDFDLVMVRLSSAEIDRVGGIWAGMSGSPVYAADGRLIGAVAYGLSYGPSPVAGVTPYEYMDDYLTTAAPARVRVNQAAARKIAARTDVTAAEADDGFSQLRMPLGVTGVGSRRLTELSGERAWMPKQTYAAGRATAGTADASSIVAGGNLAAAASYGDITMGGVGTATAVCGSRVVGFGHPMFFLGETTDFLNPADAIYVQEDSVFGAFKVANFGAPAGTITDDHLAGITGTLGALPAATHLQSSATFGSRSRTGSTDVALPRFTPSASIYQLFANQDRVIDGLSAGSALQTWTVTGHTPAGLAFTLPVTDRFVSRFDISGETPWTAADTLYALNNIDGVTLSSFNQQVAFVRDASMYAVGSVQQRRAGVWVPVDRDHPIIGWAGGTLRLRVHLVSALSTRTIWFQVGVPANAAGTRGQLRLTGGGDIYDGFESFPTSVRGVLRHFASMVRNDQVQWELGLGGETSCRGCRVSLSTGANLDGVLGPVSKVVGGSRGVPVRIN